MSDEEVLAATFKVPKEMQGGQIGLGHVTLDLGKTVTTSDRIARDYLIAQGYEEVFDTPPAPEPEPKTEENS